jgi:hypothetical protein
VRFDQSMINDPLREFVYNGNLYRYVHAEVTFYQAMDYASGQTLNGVTGHLLTIESEEEAKAIWQALTPTSVWMAISDEQEEGTWVYVDGPNTGLPIVYSNWNEWEPNNFRGFENYGAFNWDVALGWNDLPYDDLMPYIIEFEGSSEDNTVTGTPTTSGIFAIKENFDDANALVATDYQFNPGFADFNPGPGNYTLASSVFTMDDYFLVERGGGSGYMLLLDGATEAEKAIWRGELLVEAGETVEFSFWAAPTSWNSNPVDWDYGVPSLGLYLNGEKFGETLLLDGQVGTWAQFSNSWISNFDGLVQLELKSLSTNYWGNDFAIDEISAVVRDGENLIKNPGFELINPSEDHSISTSGVYTTVDQGSDYIKYWTINAGSSDLVSIDLYPYTPTLPNSGSYALDLIGRRPSNPINKVSQDISGLNVGEEYELSFLAIAAQDLSGGEHSAARVSIGDYSIVIDSQVNADSNEWREYSLRFIAQESTVDLTLEALLVSNPGIIFDNFLLTTVLPAFDIVLSSTAGSVASFAVYATETADSGDTGLEDVQFVLSHDVADMAIVAASISPAAGLTGFPNFNPSTGSLTFGGFALPPFTDLATPILTFYATILNEDAPFNITIDSIIADNTNLPGVVEEFDFSSTDVTTTVTDRFGNVLSEVSVSAYEVRIGEYVYLREVGTTDTSSVFEIVAKPTQAVSSIDFELVDNAGLIDFQVGSALSGWSIQTNTTTPDVVQFAGFGAVNGSQDLLAGQEVVLAIFETSADPDFVIDGIFLNTTAQADIAVGEVVAVSEVGNVTVHQVARGSDVYLDADKPIDHASDRAITANDALQALRLAVGLTKSDGKAEWHDFIAADINKDGQVTANDALNILKFAVGLTDGPSADWVFVDGDADWSAIGRRNTSYEEGIWLEDVVADMNVNMTGILVGDVNGNYIG